MSKCLNVGNTDSGFTLIEVLVSLGTMAIGFVILMGLHYSSIRMEWNDTRRTEAIEIARTNIEMFRVPSELNKGNSAPTDCPYSPSPYKCTFTAKSDEADPTLAGMREVKVTVEWEERMKTPTGRASLSTANSRVELITLFNYEHLFHFQ